MSTALSFLPAPKHAAPEPAQPAVAPHAPAVASIAASRALMRVAAGPPPYGQRQGFLPRTPADFGDGGAFPEIHVLQYPLAMGKDKTTTSTTVALQVDEHGKLRFDALARHGHTADTQVLSEYKDLVPMDIPHDAHTQWAKPSAEEVAETTDKTKRALELIIAGKVAATKPTDLLKKGTPTAPVVVKYTPTQHGGKAGTTRIISMVEMPVDPLEPARFGFKRLPPGPPSPPPPVLHSPPRKLTKKERAEWTIPPCISNWKNAKGYTIPLDKRLAADGRGLQEAVINDRFAHFSEALQIAERHAREEVRQRALLQKKIAEKEIELREAQLLEQAQRAREERAGFGPSSSSAFAGGASGGPDDGNDYRMDRHDDDDDEDGDDEDARAREDMRRELQAKLRREVGMSHMGSDARARAARLADQDRDISEKIALGEVQPTVARDAMFDSRLFNQSQGLGSGFGNEDGYDVYDKPLFSGAASGMSSVYRPSNKGDSEMYGGDADAAYEQLSSTDKFMPAPGRGFSGTDGGTSGSAAPGGGGPRDGPVEFERAAATFSASSEQPGSDVFGVGNLLSQARKARHPRDDDERADDLDRSAKRSRRD
ncbi:SKIP/SNW domain-containing protein [Blastocladiella britannica]|nr:SKIP/SNW domain-containing protein [Blastocladiella britannica]